MTKIKLDSSLYDRLKQVAEVAGYPSPEDFIIHIIEKELAQIETADTDEEVVERLKGLGYLE
jgi:predicted DNA-binding protein